MLMRMGNGIEMGMTMEMRMGMAIGMEARTGKKKVQWDKQDENNIRSRGE